MQDIEYFRQFEPFFEEWHIKRLIGEGGFGKVFEIERRGQFEEKAFTSAMKVITVPSSPEELKSVAASGMSGENVRSYFYETVKNFSHEITIMDDVKGQTNIVSYEDHRIVERTDGFGWYIFIRMELLKPISQQYSNMQAIPEKEVLRLGCDMCRALEACQKFGIIHRDIKPDNIFLSRTGDYKLGDFGIACITEGAPSATTKIGTPAYVAPEVLSGKKYGSSVDIYSLGVVMYQLLNDYRLPFFPPVPEPITPGIAVLANQRRLTGEPLQPPAHGSSALQAIVLRACDPDPHKRYASPVEMHTELELIRAGKVTTPMPGDTPKRKSSKKLLAAVLVVCVVLVGAGVALGVSRAKPKNTSVQAASGQTIFTNLQIQADKTTLSIGDTTELALKDGEYLYRREDGLVWTSGNKSIATVSDDGVVTGIGAGLVTITAEYQGKSAQVSINVLTGEDTTALSGSVAAPDETPPESVQVLTSTSVLLVGDSISPALQADSWTLDGNSETIAWETSDPETAEVKDGVLTAKKAGEFTLTATYCGRTSSIAMRSIDAPAANGAELSADYDSIALAQGGEGAVNITFSGNIPEKFTAVTYYSAGMSLALSWGGMRGDNSAQLTIADAYSQQTEGEVTILCCAADDPSNVVAVKKIRVKVNGR